MPSYYTTFEAARLLGVSLPTVVNWIKARRLKAHQTPGGHRRISREDLAAFFVRHGMPMPGELSGVVQGRRKALVVAGVGPAREGLVRQLVAAGYAVEQASPGFAAGVAAARFEPDVLVVQPDVADGGDAVRGPRADAALATVPVVAVAPHDWHEPLADAGCAALVLAPTPEGALAAAVERAIAGAAPRRGTEAKPAAPRRKGRTRR
jgi:excisionase family DNA binding protein